MIIYYSGIRGDICSPSVVLGDRANVMLSFWECEKSDGSAAAGFVRLERERLDKKRKPYIPYRDYHSDRKNETKYAVIDVFNKVIAGPTPLLTSLVHDYKPVSNMEFIVRLKPDGSISKKRPALYKALNNSWVAIKPTPTKQKG